MAIKSYFYMFFFVIGCNLPINNIEKNNTLSKDEKSNVSISDTCTENIKKEYISMRLMSDLSELDINILCKINEDEAPRKIPKSIIFKLFGEDYNGEVTIKSISKEGNFRDAFFYFYQDNYKYLLLINFNQNGIIIDYKCIKSSKKINGKWIVFFGDILNTSDNKLKFIFLDSTEKIQHPHLAKRKLIDLWKVNKIGVFEK